MLSKSNDTPFGSTTLRTDLQDHQIDALDILIAVVVAVAAFYYEAALLLQKHGQSQAIIIDWRGRDEALNDVAPPPDRSGLMRR